MNPKWKHILAPALSLTLLAGVVTGCSTTTDTLPSVCLLYTSRTGHPVQAHLSPYAPPQRQDETRPPGRPEARLLSG